MFSEELILLRRWFFEAVDNAAKEILKNPSHIASISLAGKNAQRMLQLILLGVLKAARDYLKKKYGIDAIVVHVCRLEALPSLYILIANRKVWKRARNVIMAAKNQLKIFTPRVLTL